MAKTTMTKNVPQIGAITHHQDQSMTPVSFSATKSTVNSPIVVSFMPLKITCWGYCQLLMLVYYCSIDRKAVLDLGMLDLKPA